MKRSPSGIEEAIANYQKAVELNPNHVMTHKNLGDLFQKLGNIIDGVILLNA